MKYKLQLSGRFKKSYKKSEQYHNHPLHGNYEGWNDCHILPDWILVWRYNNDKLELCLLDTGTHSDLFKK